MNFSSIDICMHGYTYTASLPSEVHQKRSLFFLSTEFVPIWFHFLFSLFGFLLSHSNAYLIHFV